jgi:hypothetical protein
MAAKMSENVSVIESNGVMAKIERKLRIRNRKQRIETKEVKAKKDLGEAVEEKLTKIRKRGCAAKENEMKRRRRRRRYRRKEMSSAENGGVKRKLKAKAKWREIAARSSRRSGWQR